MLFSALAELVDKSASEEDRAKIEKIALDTEQVMSVHAIRTRRMGPGIFVDLHVQVNGELSVNVGHDISELVKQNLMADGPKVYDVLVHLEPFE